VTSDSRKVRPLPITIAAFAFVAVSHVGCATVTAAERFRADAVDRYAQRGLGEMSDAEAMTRVAFIQHVLDDAAGPTRMWRYGWIVGFGALAVGSGIRAAAFGPSQVAAGLVGAGGSLLGVGSVLLNDEHATHAGDDLRGYLAHTSDPWPLRVRVAEQALRECARVEAFSRGWLSQIARAVVSVSSWAIITFAANQPGPAAINLGAGLVIGQLSVVTHPQGLISVWDSYAQRHPDVEGRQIPWANVSPLRWAVVPSPTGLDVMFSF
jgi:hypothetical protein